MSYRDKLEKLRKEIRKQHLFGFFHQQRMTFKDSRLTKEADSINYIPNLEELKQISQEAQSEHCIQNLRSLGWLQVLYQFMDNRYLATQQQFFASSAMCNLLILGEHKPPSQKLTNDLLQLLNSQDSSLLTSILSAFFNLIYDHPQWCENLVFHTSLVELVNRLFQVETSNVIFLKALLRTVNLLLEKVKPNTKLLMLLDSLVSLSTIIDSSLLSPILRSIYQFCLIMPKESSLKLQQNFFISKLGSSLKYSNDVSTLELFLKISSLICSQISHKDFVNYLLPIIKNKRTKSRSLELLSYRMVQIGLEEHLITPNQFWKNPLKDTILTIYEETDDEGILTELSYIFCVCLLNLSLQKEVVEKLKSLFSRASQLLGDNLEIKGYIEETIQMYHSLYQ